MKVLFEEKQRFDQWWIWAILVIVAVLTIPTTFYSNVGNGGRNWSQINTEDIAGMIIILVVIILFLLLRLKTTITTTDIRMVYFPIVWKTVAVRDTVTLEVIDHGFVGGWGIRWFTTFGTVYNVRGQKGLHIKTNKGKGFVIGTQKPEELRKSLEHLMEI